MVKFILLDRLCWRLKGNHNSGEGHSSQVQSYKYVLGSVYSSCMMLLGQQVCWDLPHRGGSASLTSLSSLNKDGHNLLFCFSLHIYLPPVPSCIIYHPCLFLSLSTWIYFYFGSFPLFSQHVFFPVSGVIIPAVLLSPLVLWVRVAHSNRE